VPASFDGVNTCRLAQPEALEATHMRLGDEGLILSGAQRLNLRTARLLAGTPSGQEFLSKGLWIGIDSKEGVDGRPSFVIFHRSPSVHSRHTRLSGTQTPSRRPNFDASPLFHRPCSIVS
jgi:hypothetical protein